MSAAKRAQSGGAAAADRGLSARAAAAVRRRRAHRPQRAFPRRRARAREALSPARRRAAVWLRGHDRPLRGGGAAAAHPCGDRRREGQPQANRDRQGRREAQGDRDAQRAATWRSSSAAKCSSRSGSRCGATGRRTGPRSGAWATNMPDADRVDRRPRSCCTPILTARRACSSRPSRGRTGGCRCSPRAPAGRARAMRGTLLAFQPLSASWSGRGEVRTLVRCEWHGGQPLLGGERLLCGFYLNELLLRLLPREDPHERCSIAIANSRRRSRTGPKRRRSCARSSAACWRSWAMLCRSSTTRTRVTPIDPDRMLPLRSGAGRHAAGERSSPRRTCWSCRGGAARDRTGRLLRRRDRTDSEAADAPRHQPPARPATAAQPDHLPGARQPMIELGVNIDHVATRAPGAAHLRARSGVGGRRGAPRRRRRHHRPPARGPPPHPGRGRAAAARAHAHQAQPGDGGDRRDGRHRLPHQAGDGDARSRGPAGDHHRGRPRLVAREAGAASTSSRGSRRRASSSACSSTPTRARSRRRSASAPRSARSIPGRTRTRSTRAGATRRARRSSRSSPRSPRRARRSARAACASTPAMRSTTSTSSRWRAARRARAPHRARDRQPRGVRRHARGGAGDEDAHRQRRDARGDQEPAGDRRHRHRPGRDRADRAGARALRRALRAQVLVPRELARFAAHRKPAAYLAKRFAAKEAFSKAMGTGIRARSTGRASAS